MVTLLDLLCEGGSEEIPVLLALELLLLGETGPASFLFLGGREWLVGLVEVVLLEEVHGGLLGDLVVDGDEAVLDEGFDLALELVVLEAVAVVLGVEVVAVLVVVLAAHSAVAVALVGLGQVQLGLLVRLLVDLLLVLLQVAREVELVQRLRGVIQRPYLVDLQHEARQARLVVVVEHRHDVRPPPRVP